MSLAATWIPDHAFDSRERRDIRNDSVRHAVYLHSDTGDAMAVLSREDAVRDVLATAEEFYRWVTQDEEDEK